MGAFFVVEALHSGVGDRRYLSLRAYSSWDGALIAEEHRAYPLEDDLSEAPLGAELLPIMKEYLESEGARNLASQLDLMKSREEEESPVEFPAPDESEVAEEQGRAELPGYVDPQQPEGTAGKEETPQPAISRSQGSPLLFSFEGGPYLSTFEGAEYFSAGLFLSLHGQYRFSFTRFILTAGGTGHFMGFSPRGSRDESESSFWSLGGEIGLEQDLPGPFRYFLRTSAGGSLLVMDTDNNGLLSKIVPYAALGGGAAISLKDRWGVSFSIESILYMENSIFLSGFIPALGVCYQ